MTIDDPQIIPAVMNGQGQLFSLLESNESQFPIQDGTITLVRESSIDPINDLPYLSPGDLIQFELQVDLGRNIAIDLSEIKIELFGVKLVGSRL